MENALWALAGVAAVAIAIFVGRQIGQWLVTSPTPTSLAAGALIRLEKENPALYISSAVIEQVRSELKGAVTAEQILAVLSFSKHWQPETWERAKANYAALESIIAESPELKAKLEGILLDSLGDKSFDPVAALRGQS